MWIIFPCFLKSGCRNIAIVTNEPGINLDSSQFLSKRMSFVKNRWYCQLTSGVDKATARVADSHYSKTFRKIFRISETSFDDCLSGFVHKAVFALFER
ncbi:MAG: hypothetical protein BWY75_03252 [bacterium ADurb.Bin425]|nr:MAG: hypothetical protein BWY75_03252 [bacterium ADurb.Bin425]